MSVLLYACRGDNSEEASAYGPGEQNGRPETESQTESEEKPEAEPMDMAVGFTEQYSQVIAELKGGRTALLYLDDDSVPELLILKDGEY